MLKVMVLFCSVLFCFGLEDVFVLVLLLLFGRLRVGDLGSETHFSVRPSGDAVFFAYSLQSRCTDSCTRDKIQGSGFRVQGLGFGVQKSGFVQVGRLGAGLGRKAVVTRIAMSLWQLCCYKHISKQVRMCI